MPSITYTVPTDLTVGGALVVNSTLQSAGKFTINEQSAAVYGAELITNQTDRDFSGANNWVLPNADWQITANGLEKVAANFGASVAYLPEAYINGVASGKHYQVSFTIVTTTATVTGSNSAASPRLGSTLASDGTYGKSTGTYITNFVILSATNGSYPSLNLSITASTTDWRGYIDNVSIKEVIPAPAVYSVYNSGSSTQLEEFRNFSATQSVYFGRGAGQYAVNSLAYYNTVFGRTGFNLTSGNNNSLFGFNCGRSLTSGSGNICFGWNSFTIASTASYNCMFGYSSLTSLRDGQYNIAIGSSALIAAMFDDSYNIAIGRNAGISNLNYFGGIDRTLCLGNYAGAYNTGSDTFFVNMYDRVNASGDRTKSLMYGTFNSNEALQTLTVNAALTVSSTTASTSTTTGALIVSGGAGIGGELYVGGAIKSSSATAGIGYGSGAGGTVVQDTSKTTGVELNKVCGQITLNNEELAANTSASFTLTNSAIAVTDQVMINHVAGGTPAAYIFSTVPNAGSCAIHVRNITSGNLSEAIVLQFLVIKSVAS